MGSNYPFAVSEKRASYAMICSQTDISGALPNVRPGVRRPFNTDRHSLRSSSSSESLRPQYKRIGCCPTAPRNKSAKMRTALPMMDCNDFDNLPPAVRRKYFSSLERLRYAQQQSNYFGPSATHHRNLSTHSVKFPRPRSRSKGRSSNDSYRSARPTSKNNKCSKPSKQPASADSFILSQADAKWFLELPETVRRKLFSAQEQVILARQCESIIVDAADESLYRMGRQVNRSLNTLDSFSSTERISREPSIERDAHRVAEEFRKSFRWMDEDGSLDLRLNDWYSSSPEEEAPPPRGRRLRTLSLSTIPRAQTSSSTSSSSSTSTSASTATSTYSSSRMSISSNRTAPNCISHSGSHSALVQRNIHSSDKDAAYYQDPETRLKLRVYLASPQKFDEAIEFGFPSTTDASEFLKGRPRTATIRKVEDLDDPLDWQDEEFDSASVTLNDFADDVDSWHSSETSDVLSSPRVSNGNNSYRPRLLVDHYPHSSPGNREMTLRMTLTRKDLRADEADLYGWKKDGKKDDPLALEELPPMGDADGMAMDWNAGRDNSGLKKLWRRVRGNSR
ncbi:hypothetical protein RUND412_009107 [Rhizina undulata]